MDGASETVLIPSSEVLRFLPEFGAADVNSEAAAAEDVDDKVEGDTGGVRNGLAANAWTAASH